MSVWRKIEPNQNYYIDPWIKQAFDASGLTSEQVSKAELSHLSQSFRSADGYRILRELTGHEMNTPEERTTFFQAIKENKINLNDILSDSGLQKFKERKTPFNID